MILYTSLIHENELLIYCVESSDLQRFTARLVNQFDVVFYRYFRNIELQKRDARWFSSLDEPHLVYELVLSIEQHMDQNVNL